MFLCSCYMVFQNIFCISEEKHFYIFCFPNDDLKNVSNVFFTFRFER